MQSEDPKPGASDAARRPNAAMTFFDFLAQRIAARLKSRNQVPASIPAEGQSEAKGRRKKGKR